MSKLGRDVVWRASGPLPSGVRGWGPVVTLAWRRARNIWWGRVTPRAAQPPPQAACWYTPAPGPTGAPCPDCEKYRRALTWISGYWLGPTAVCQVHVDHMKGIARRALGEPYV